MHNVVQDEYFAPVVIFTSNTYLSTEADIESDHKRYLHASLSIPS